jgi:cell division septum initiation protein DivIVA
MNASAILALLGDLYTQIVALQQRVEQLEQQNAELTAAAESKGRGDG